MMDLPPSTLRAWHRRYDLPLSAPQNGSHRRYGQADVHALLRMKHLIQQGLTAEAAAARAFHSNGVTDVDTLLGAVRQLKIETVTALLEAHLVEHDVIETWDRLCRPALAALGRPDADRCIDLIHGLSWAITVALHRIPAPISTAPPILLACVEGERHTLPLEVLRAALAERRHSALFLGASIPEAALQDAVDRTDPAAVVLWSSRLTALPHRIRARRIVLVGPGWPTKPGQAPHPASVRDAVALLTAGA
jgi:DNA-binding transcriptional MerR regulator